MCYASVILVSPSADGRIQNLKILDPSSRAELTTGRSKPG